MRKYHSEFLIEQKVDLSREKDEHLKVTSLSTTKCLRKFGRLNSKLHQSAALLRIVVVVAVIAGVAMMVVVVVMGDSFIIEFPLELIAFDLLVQ